MRDRLPIQRARHDLKRTQAAFRRRIRQPGGDVQDREKIPRRERLCDLLVELRAFRRESVRTVLFQLVGEVPARDQDGAAAELFRGHRDALPEMIMRKRRQTGQADADEPVSRINLIQKIQRDQRSVVEALVPFAERSGGQALLLCDL